MRHLRYKENEKKGTNLDKLCVISSMLSLFITLYRQCLLQKFPSHAKFNRSYFPYDSHMVSVLVGAIFGNDKEFEYNFLIISRYLNLVY
jgi:hypothetical protein